MNKEATLVPVFLDLCNNSSLDDGLSMSEGSRNAKIKLKKVNCRVCREEVNFQSYLNHLKVIPYTISQAVDTIVCKQPDVDFMM